VTLEIEARLPNGTSEQIVRAVTEISRTIKFASHGFEKDKCPLLPTPSALTPDIRESRDTTRKCFPAAPPAPRKLTRADGRPAERG
jgi:hypothetical protein